MMTGRAARSGGGVDSEWRKATRFGSSRTGRAGGIGSGCEVARLARNKKSMIGAAIGDRLKTTTSRTRTKAEWRSMKRTRCCCCGGGDGCCLCYCLLDGCCCSRCW
jgi:hypothetical protein